MKKATGKATPKEKATARKMLDQMGMGSKAPAKTAAKKGKKGC